MQLVFLGVWGAEPLRGQTSCVLLKTTKANLIFDAGTGLACISNHIDCSKPTHILLSHVHLDHLIGLTYLVNFFKGKELWVHGQKGFKQAVETIFTKPLFPLSVAQHPFKIHLSEMKSRQKIAGARVITAPLEHTDPSVGIRVEAQGRAITYITDTMPCKNALALAKGADVLIHEAYYTHKDWQALAPTYRGHSSQKTAAELAASAGVKKLLLFHLNPAYNTSAIAKLAREAKQVFKNTFIPKDCMHIKV